MISLEKIQESILELERGDTSFSVCQKLADLYTVRNNLISTKASNKIIKTDRNSEFLELINGKDENKIFGIIDELMSTLLIMNKKAYDYVLNQIKNI